MSLAFRTGSARPSRRAVAHPRPKPDGPGWLLGSEAVAGGLGFLVLVYQARRLGPSSFAAVEYAAAVTAWLLVVVRGGMDVIVYREAARRPRLVRPLTDLLIGLRLVAALAGYALILGFAATAGPGRVAVLPIAGLSLFASAFSADVGLRASCRYRALAAAQVVRALGVSAAVLATVRGPSGLYAAAFCLAGGEAFGAVVPLWCHARRYGLPSPRVRRLASLTIARRGAVAGLTRFARVTLYGLDLLALGWCSAAELSPYAAARRVAFAVVALGLVVPAALGPALAAAWSHGVESTRRRVGEALAWTWSLSLPAAVGLGLTADRWMPFLFGDAYRGGGPWLALVAARLPWLLTASLAQAILVACRREGWALRLAAGQLALAVFLFPPALLAAGPWGVGWAAQVVETAGAVAGWVMLARLGVAPGWPETVRPAFAGCLALAAVCRLSQGEPLWLVVAAGAAAYGVVWRSARRHSSPERLAA